ncbi:lamin tail domain-containing protein [Candidatus Microgenomates bacterium]|nr:lamin tail domain-containing protein [Candidatus Microgenomates bacterium]
MPKEEIKNLEELVEKRRKKKEEGKDKRRLPIIPFFFGCLLPLLLLLGLIWFNPFRGRQAFDPENRVVYDSPLDINGQLGNSDSKIKIFLDGLLIDADNLIINPDGSFSFVIDLNPGENDLLVREERSDGTEATIIDETIEYIVGPGPELVISSPNDESVVIDPNITVIGDTDPGATVEIDGQDTPVDDDGHFEAEIILDPGDNTIDIVASDEDGSTSESISVNYNNDDSDSGNDDGSNGSGNNENDNGGGGGNGNNGGGDNSGGDNGNGNGNGSDGGGDNDGGNNDPPPIIIYPSKIIVSYILYSLDINGEGQDEYVEVRNTGDGEKDLAGWTVRDSDGHVFTFPGFLIQPGQTIRINTNKGGFSFLTDTAPVWDRIGEPAYLRNASGELVDVYSYQ